MNKISLLTKHAIGRLSDEALEMIMDIIVASEGKPNKLNAASLAFRFGSSDMMRHVREGRLPRELVGDILQQRRMSKELEGFRDILYSNKWKRDLAEANNPPKPAPPPMLPAVINEYPAGLDLGGPKGSMLDKAKSKASNVVKKIKDIRSL